MVDSDGNNTNSDFTRGDITRDAQAQAGQDNGVHEWIEQAIPAGSGRYYALLHSDPALQQNQRLVATLISIFSKLGFQSREVEVARHKLDWWRQELEKDTYSHPVMAAFDSVTPVMRAQLTQLLSGYGTLLESGSPSTDEQNLKFHLDTGAVAFHLLSGTQSDNTTVSDAGIVLSRFRCIRYLRQHVDSGLLCLPMSSLDAAEISPALLTPTASNEIVGKYLSAELAALEQQMQNSLTALVSLNAETSDINRSNYKALYIYLALQYRLLHSMRKDSTSVVTEVSRLTPIRNYWYAFLAARKFDKTG